MATRESARTGGAAPIQIQAQFLRDWQSFAPPGPMSGFAIAPEEEALRPVKTAGRRGNWREKDVARAIGAAREAGLTSYRVEIGPDGTISIIVSGADDDGGAAPDGGL
jgi:hypothetical protein